MVGGQYSDYFACDGVKYGVFSCSSSLFRYYVIVVIILGKRIKWLILPLHESETDRHLIGLSG